MAQAGLVVLGAALLVGSCAKMDSASSAPPSMKSEAPSGAVMVDKKAMELEEESLKTGGFKAKEAAQEPMAAPEEPAPGMNGQVKAYRPPSAAKPAKMPPPAPKQRVRMQERKRNARKVVAKKTIAGAFMAKADATKLFAQGEEAESGEGQDGGEGGGAPMDDSVAAPDQDEEEDEDDRDNTGLALAGLGKQGALGAGQIERVGIKRRPFRRRKRVKTKALKREKPRANNAGRRLGGKGRRDGWADNRGRRGKDFAPSTSRRRISKKLPRPTSFLPRMCYFENTYLGGNAAYLERLRRLDKAFSPGDRAYRQAAASVPDLTPPATRGLAVSATLSRRSLAEPGRVFLQVGIAGSSRYGWRRPPLDIVAVVDPSLFRSRKAVVDALRHLASRLGGQDRLGVVVAANTPRLIVEPVSARELRFALARKLDTIRGQGMRPRHLAAAMDFTAGVFEKLNGNVHRVPGSQVALLLVGSPDARRVSIARSAAHRLTLSGVTTSVLSARHGAGENAWWRVANAGHGSLRQFDARNATTVIDRELEGLSRTVARLIRVNIRLGKHAHAIRVVGAKVLNQRQVKRVKAREKVMDRKLAATMGVKADRGDDDDGIQTVIPYFLGGDRHAIFVELWLDKPGHVADVELRYKDLVNTGNARASVAVTLPHFGRPETDAHYEVVASAERAGIAAVLKNVRQRVMRYNNTGARQLLRRAMNQHQDGPTRAMLRRFDEMLRRGVPMNDLQSALEVAAWRQVGEAADVNTPVR